jgi:dGTPase
MGDGTGQQETEDGMAATFACNPEESRGRLYPEEESLFRSPFQRDRDRIIHSSAFRRLKHKTQVFLEHEGDYYRTRLTHSIEVAQVARTISGVLGLNEQLTEAVALAHDLGHTPFGHTGEDALDALMQPYGGFDHNAQALRIVTSLERHYAEFDGLNLTWETLEGIAKHNGPVTGELPVALAEYNALHDLELDTHASAEAQVAALSDDIAYNNHDLHDAIRARLITEEEIAAVPMIERSYAAVDQSYPSLDMKRRRHEALRRVFGVMVEDVLTASRAAIAEVDPHSATDVRHAGRQIVRFSDEIWEEMNQLRGFLFRKVYRAPSVVKMREEVTTIVNELFPLFMENPDFLPAEWRDDVARAGDERALARIVADYIAGMTDRFAIETHGRFIGGTDTRPRLFAK